MKKIQSSEHFLNPSVDNAAIEAQCLNWPSAKAIFDQIRADGLCEDEDVSGVLL